MGQSVRCLCVDTSKGSMPSTIDASALYLALQAISNGSSRSPHKSQGKSGRIWRHWQPRWLCADLSGLGTWPGCARIASQSKYSLDGCPSHAHQWDRADGEPWSAKTWRLQKCQQISSTMNPSPGKAGTRCTPKTGAVWLTATKF